MFCSVEALNDYLLNCFGESGKEAFQDAIIYYLSHCKDFPCEEDKLVLLSYLYFSGSDAIHYLKDDSNPLLHFSINLFSEKTD